MANALSRWFGIELEVDPYVNVNEYGEFSKELAGHLRALPNIDLKDVDVHIHRLVIDFVPLRFGIGPLERRLENLDVTIGLHKSKKGRRSVWFLNKDLPIRITREIEVKARAHNISYSLSGAYCAQHRRFSDYVATAIKRDSNQRDRWLSVTATAHPTDDFLIKVQNVRATTTKIPFALTKETQLPIPI